MSNFQIHELNSVAVNRNSNIIHDTEVSTDEWDTGKNIAGAVADLANENVAAPYDETVTYAIGQYCLREGNIYRCIAPTTGTFDATKWTQIVVTGEFRRVVELTSAQYTALSSAEKNNGTLYIKTDEETTAADIPYSAGVSVADKLDTIEDDITPFKRLKTYDHTEYLTVNANTIATFDITVPKSDYRLVAGIGISSNENVLLIQYYFSSSTNLHFRVRNLSSQAQQFSFFVTYI